MKARTDFITEGEYIEYLRTYAAIAAMQGMIGHAMIGFQDSFAFDSIARDAIAAADALIEQLNKPL